MIRGDSGSSSGGQLLNVWVIAGVIILVLFGIGIIVGGVLLTKEGQPGAEATQPAPPPTPASVLPTVGDVSAPTFTPLPTATPLPETPSESATDIPPSATTPSAMIEVGEGGVNVRSGPGTDFDTLGRLESGENAIVTGRYADWWQIDYGGTPGWVAGWVVTASNTDGVAEVVPPASPVPSTSVPAPPAAPTEAPSAGLPGLTADLRGLVVGDYQVEGAPGPYSVGACIRFHMWIDNNSGMEIQYDALGTWVFETEQFQKSYFAIPPSYPSFMPSQNFSHTDCIKISQAGTYHLYLAIHFKDGTPALMKGPVKVVVQ
jgi:hypothetical protein